ncbi:hypothetical protein CAEBREN_03722 [Caenorhabditis brenneri]|uniref:BTB domain-containing protein n=1 Tax=Caenorhabditis brenneri TaxID=135651 RepID=G0MV08_CAEBE|nr:hypothetical protein CAEBREN_03722 [Caenorhabditis brenneri]
MSKRENEAPVQVVPPKLRKFEGLQKEFYDVTLIVGDTRFQVLKAQLAQQSDVFHTLFFGEYAEKNKKEITLEEVDPTYFQKFLELIHLEVCLTDGNIEGVMKICKMFLVQSALGHCQEFLIFKSKLPIRKKWDLALDYGFTGLRDRIIQNVKGKTDLERLIPKDLSEWDQSTTRQLFEKTLIMLGIQYPPR